MLARVIVAGLESDHRLRARGLRARGLGRPCRRGSRRDGCNSVANRQTSASERRERAARHAPRHLLMF
eukprot:4109751-Prymnesium_polylepis.1